MHNQHAVTKALTCVYASININSPLVKPELNKLSAINCNVISRLQAPVGRYKFVYYIKFNPTNTKEAI